MKNLTLITILIITFSLSACGPSLEEGPCTNKVELEYEATIGWFGEVNSKATTYDSYDEYLAAYNEPLERWQALEPITTCDAALITLMVEYLTTGTEENDGILDDILNFDFDIMHTGK